MKQHTPGLLRLCNDGECTCLQIWTDNHPIAVVEHGEWGDSYPAIRPIGSSLEATVEAYMEHIVYGEIPAEIAKANAQHLVACWNFCAGINPEAVPELLEACKSAIRYDNSIAGRAIRGDYDLSKSGGGIASGDDLDKLYANWITKARAAVVKATK